MAIFDELEREIKRLSYHRSFKPMDAFRKLDNTNKGYVTAEDIQRYFGDNDGYSESAPELIAYWSNWQDDGRLTFEDWHQVLMGHPVPASFRPPQGYSYFKRTVEQVTAARRHGYVNVFYPQKAEGLQYSGLSYSMQMPNSVFIGNEHQKSLEQMAWRK